MKRITWTQEKSSFYKYACRISVPIAAQNLISALVSSVDVIMLGYVSQDALAASSLANQLQFILATLFYGLSSGVSIMVAQYWGKRDTKTIEQIMGLAFRFFFGLSVIFAAASFFFPGPIMAFFTNEPALIELGTDYLRVVSVAYLFMGFSSFYLNTMRSMERVMLSTVTYFVSLCVNITLNATFIFGLFGAPKLGLVGVAIGTAAARAVETLICLVDNALRRHPVHFHLRSVFGHYQLLMRDFIKLVSFSTLNDCIWGIGTAMYSVVIGHLGTEAVAANSVASVIRNLTSVVCLGFANATAIVLGKAMGQGALELAKTYSKRMLLLTFISGVASGIIILCGSPLLIGIMGRDLSATAHEYLRVMIVICSYYMIGMGLNTCWICGCFRAGGDMRFGFLLDIWAMWGWGVPMGFIAAFILKLPVEVVYFVLCTDEFIKMPIVIHHYRKMGWLKNITRSREELDGVAVNG